MLYSQALIFMIFTLDGFIIGIIFDIFRAFRKIYKAKDIFIYIQDIFFWMISGSIFLFSMSKFANGELRGFMIFGTLIGISVYILSLSNNFKHFFTKLFEFIKKIANLKGNFKKKGE